MVSQPYIIGHELKDIESLLFPDAEFLSFWAASLNVS